MGIGKKAVTNKGKKLVENATDGIPVVGDLVDNSIKSGPADRAGDSLEKSKNQRGRDNGKGTLGRK